MKKYIDYILVFIGTLALVAAICESNPYLVLITMICYLGAALLDFMNEVSNPL